MIIDNFYLIFEVMCFFFFNFNHIHKCLTSLFIFHLLVYNLLLVLRHTSFGLIFKFTVLYIHMSLYVIHAHLIYRLFLKKNDISVQNIGILSYFCSVFCFIVQQDRHSRFDWLIRGPSKAVWTSQNPYGPAHKTEVFVNKQTYWLHNKALIDQLVRSIREIFGPHNWSIRA